MEDLTEAFRLDKMRSGNAVVYVLKEEFERFLSSPQGAERCDWIGRCFYQLDQFEEAGTWFEAAGKLTLSEPTSPMPTKALNALAEYEKAADCYERCEDDESFTECSSLIARLRKACAPA